MCFSRESTPENGDTLFSDQNSINDQDEKSTDESLRKLRSELLPDIHHLSCIDRKSILFFYQSSEQHLPPTASSIWSMALP